jgi:hypothetical protein
MVLYLTGILISTGICLAQESPCNQQQSQQEIQRLKETRLISSVDSFPPNITVVVEEGVWRRSGGDMKRKIAQDVLCASAGPDDQSVWVVFFRGKTNRPLGEFRKGRLTTTE